MTNGPAIYSAVENQTGDELVMNYASLVKRIAYHLLNRLPQTIQLDDLIQSGMIGLLEAAAQYDATQGASFRTYAGIRIRGAMLDEVRRLDWTPRSVHRKSREVAEAIREIENRTGRDAKDTEICAALGISMDEYHHIIQDVNVSRLFSIEQLEAIRGESEEPADDKIQPLDIIQKENFQNALAEAIRNLPEREQLVMSLYYDDELNLREIGEVLGVSESRVSQIHGRIMLKLRASMSDWIGE